MIRRLDHGARRAALPREGDREAGPRKDSSPGPGQLGDAVEEATVADVDLQKLLAGVAQTRREMADPFPVPPGWGFHELSLFDYWTRVLDLERAQADGPAALGLALAAYELESLAHVEWLKERFEKRYGEDPDFGPAQLEARPGRS